MQFLEKSMKTYVFDIDGTICRKNKDQDYEQSIPIASRILVINELYDKGNIVIFHTARGMGRYNNNIEKAKNDFYDLTVKQLKDWGVKYHKLFLGKPAGDLYVDDKGQSDIEYFESITKNKT